MDKYTLVLSEMETQQVIDILQNGPYRIVGPIINTIMGQCNIQDKRRMAEKEPDAQPVEG